MTQPADRAAAVYLIRGSLTSLVNARASWQGDMQDFDDKWQQIIDVNLTGTFWVCRPRPTR